MFQIAGLGLCKELYAEAKVGFQSVVTQLRELSPRFFGTH